jgi:hypothetical protein
MHSVTETLSPLSEWCASDASGSDRKLISPAGNARPHTARRLVEFFEDNRMKTAPRPPYSPDIALSDVCLSECVKACLAGRSFVNAEGFFEAVRGILDSIEM